MSFCTTYTPFYAHALVIYVTKRLNYRKQINCSIRIENVPFIHSLIHYGNYNNKTKHKTKKRRKRNKTITIETYV